MTKPKKITLASQDQLARIEHLAPRFFREVLEMDYFECLITDESDLLDFTDAFSENHQGEVSVMLDRLEAHYLVDGRKALSTRIVDLLEFLELRGVTG